MQERLIKVLKALLIAFGVVFLLQVIFLTLIFIGIFKFSDFRDFDKFDFKMPQVTTHPKEITPIIEQAEKYRLENGKYPEKLENVKTKKEFKYEATKDGNCYTVTMEDKGKTKQYQECKLNSEGSSSISQNYIELNK